MKIHYDSNQACLQSKCYLNAGAKRMDHNLLSLVVSEFAVLGYASGEELSCHSYFMRADLFLRESHFWGVSHACS